MNATNISYMLSLNLTFDSYQLFLDLVGSTWILDSLYLFLLTPLSIVSFLSNLISFLIFFKKEFNKVVLFSYLRGNCILINYKFKKHISYSNKIFSLYTKWIYWKLCDYVFFHILLATIFQLFEIIFFKNIYL
jgi:hypothetical protein